MTNNNTTPINICSDCNKEVSHFSCGSSPEDCRGVDGTTSATHCCHYDRGLDPSDICPCYTEMEISPNKPQQLESPKWQPKVGPEDSDPSYMAWLTFSS